MASNVPSTTLKNIFSGMAENTFHVQFGVADPPLVDYLSDLLVRFVRQDSVDRLRTATGRHLRSVHDMLVEAEQRVGTAKRQVHRHVGDFALFWAGLFPESLRYGRGATAGDAFGEYCAHGKRAYMIASTLQAHGEDDPPCEVLERLSHQFEMCAYGLREVRRELDRRDDDDDGVRPYLIN